MCAEYSWEHYESMREWDQIGYLYSREDFRYGVWNFIYEHPQYFLNLVCEVAKRLDDLKDDYPDELLAELKQQRIRFEQMKKSLPKYLEEDEANKMGNELEGIFLAYPQFDELYDRLVRTQYKPVMDQEQKLYGALDSSDSENFVVGGYLPDEEDEEGEGQYYVCEAQVIPGGIEFGSLSTLEALRNCSSVFIEY